MSNVNLKIISVNVNGVNSKLDSLTHLLNETNADICLLQETKALHLNNFKHQNYTSLHLSGMDSTADLTNVCKGGLGFLFKKSINFEQISSHSRPENLDLDTFSRVLTVKLLDFGVYLTNIYLPAPDSNLDQEQNSEKLIKVLAYHTSITEGLNNELTAGDFNSAPTDLNWRRDLISDHFQNFSETDLEFCDSNSFTYTSYCHQTTRHLDRFISTVPTTFKNFQILYDQDIGSDHLPIQAVFEFSKITENQPNTESASIRQVNWARANSKNIQAFQEIVTSKIKKEFRHLNSTSDHNEAVLEKLLIILEQAAQETIPKYKKSGHVKAKIPNWKEEVEPTKAVLDYWSVRLSMTDKNDQINYAYARKMKSLSHSRFRHALRKQRALAKQLIVNKTSTENCFKIINKDDFRQSSPPLELEGNKPGQDQLNFWDQHYRETLMLKIHPSNCLQI